MSNNKGFKKILAVALLSTMGLIACGGEVKATPTNHKDPVISFTESNGEIYNNLMSIIEDAYRDSSLGSAVLDKVLYQYSVAVFGRYNEVSKPTNLQGDLTLRQIAAELKAGKHENKKENTNVLQQNGTPSKREFLEHSMMPSVVAHTLTPENTSMKANILLNSEANSKKLKTHIAQKPHKQLKTMN